MYIKINKAYIGVSPRENYLTVYADIESDDPQSKDIIFQIDPSEYAPINFPKITLPRAGTSIEGVYRWENVQVGHVNKNSQGINFPLIWEYQLNLLYEGETYDSYNTGISKILGRGIVHNGKATANITQSFREEPDDEDLDGEYTCMNAGTQFIEARYIQNGKYMGTKAIGVIDINNVYNFKVYQLANRIINEQEKLVIRLVVHDVTRGTLTDREPGYYYIDYYNTSGTFIETLQLTKEIDPEDPTKKCYMYDLLLDKAEVEQEGIYHTYTFKCSDNKGQEHVVNDKRIDITTPHISNITYLNDNFNNIYKPGETINIDAVLEDQSQTITDNYGNTRQLPLSGRTVYIGLMSNHKDPNYPNNDSQKSNEITITTDANGEIHTTYTIKENAYKTIDNVELNPNTYYVYIRYPGEKNTDTNRIIMNPSLAITNTNGFNMQFWDMEIKPSTILRIDADNNIQFTQQYLKKGTATVMNNMNANSKIINQKGVLIDNQTLKTDANGECTYNFTNTSKYSENKYTLQIKGTHTNKKNVQDNVITRELFYRHKVKGNVTITPKETSNLQVGKPIIAKCTLGDLKPLNNTLEYQILVSQNINGTNKTVYSTSKQTYTVKNVDNPQNEEISYTFSPNNLIAGNATVTFKFFENEYTLTTELSTDGTFTIPSGINCSDVRITYGETAHIQTTCSDVLTKPVTVTLLKTSGETINVGTTSQKTDKTITFDIPKSYVDQAAINSQGNRADEVGYYITTNSVDGGVKSNTAKIRIYNDVTLGISNYKKYIYNNKNNPQTYTYEYNINCSAKRGRIHAYIATIDGNSKYYLPSFNIEDGTQQKVQLTAKYIKSGVDYNLYLQYEPPNDSYYNSAQAIIYKVLWIKEDPHLTFIAPTIMNAGDCYVRHEYPSTLSPTPTGTITYTVDNASWNGNIGESKIIDFSSVRGKTKTINIRYNGDAYYYPIETSLNVTVRKQPTISITVDPASEITKGDTRNVTVQVLYEGSLINNLLSAALTTPSGKSITLCDNQSGSGKYTWKYKFDESGTYNITARVPNYDIYESRIGGISITVKEPPKQEETPTTTPVVEKYITGSNILKAVTEGNASTQFNDLYKANNSKEIVVLIGENNGFDSRIPGLKKLCELKKSSSDYKPNIYAFVVCYNFNAAGDQFDNFIDPGFTQLSRSTNRDETLVAQLKRIAQIDGLTGVIIAGVRPANNVSTNSNYVTEANAIHTTFVNAIKEINPNLKLGVYALTPYKDIATNKGRQGVDVETLQSLYNFILLNPTIDSSMTTGQYKSSEVTSDNIKTWYNGRVKNFVNAVTNKNCQVVAMINRSKTSVISLNDQKAPYPSGHANIYFNN